MVTTTITVYLLPVRLLRCELLTAYLRPSKIDASKHSRALLKLLVRGFARPGLLSLTIRADAASAAGADALVRFPRDRICAWPGRNPVLERSAADWPGGPIASSARPPSRNGSSACFSSRPRAGPLAAGDRQGRAQRAREQPVRRGQCPGARRALRGVYCRGEHGEPISGAQLTCSRLASCPGSWPISSACSWLGGVRAGPALRRTTLLDTDLEKAQVGTIRLKLLKVARWSWSADGGRVSPGHQLPVPGSVPRGV